MKINENPLKIPRSLVKHFPQLARSGATRGELRLQITDHSVRQPHVLFNQLEQRFILFAGLEQLERRDAESFLEYFGRIAGIRSRYPATDIGVMADDDGKSAQGSVMEDRREHEDVR